MKLFAGLVTLLMLIAAPVGNATYNTDITEQIYQKQVRQVHIQCMTEAIYFEARGEDQYEQWMVASVILNRVYDSRFPDDICAVIYQGQTQRHPRSKAFRIPKRDRCQFSYYCDGNSETIKDQETYKRIQQLVVDILDEPEYDIVNRATHYHARHVSPRWSKVFRKVAEGTHLYYVDPS